MKVFYCFDSFDLVWSLPFPFYGRRTDPTGILNHALGACFAFVYYL